MTKTYGLIDVYQRLLESEGWQILLSMEDLETEGMFTFYCKYQGNNVNNNYDYNKSYTIDVHTGASKRIVTMVHE